MRTESTFLRIACKNEVGIILRFVGIPLRIGGTRSPEYSIEVSDEVAEVFLADARYEMAYQRRLSRHKAQYSLDCEDGIEYSACLHEPTPQELLERMELFIRLWNALNSLPEVQGRRVDACVILGKTYSEVAEAEGVDESAVRRAVERGLENMKKYLKKSR